MMREKELITEGLTAMAHEQKTEPSTIDGASRGLPEVNRLDVAEPIEGA